MTEAHEQRLAVLHLLHEVGHVVGRVDLAQHHQHGLVGATVQRAVEGGDAGVDGRVGVHLRRPHRSHGRGGAVLLVVGVQDEQDVEGAHQARVDLVVGAEEHLEDVGAVVERRVGSHELLALVVAECHGPDGRHLRDDVDHRVHALGCTLHFLGLGVQRGQLTEARLEDAHRVGVLGEGVDGSADLGLHHHALTDLLLEAGEFLGRRQLAVDEEPCHLEEGALGRQLLDGVAAVPQYAGVAVEEGDG